MNSFIKSLMEEKGLQQNKLAEILGVSPAAVSQWNEDATHIRIEYLFSLSKLFHISVDELLEGKRKGESLEDKWKREYTINEEAAKDALIDGEKDKALKYFSGLKKANDKFFALFEKKVIGTISESESKEWEYLKQFYDSNIYRCHLLNDMRIGRTESITEKIILQTLKEKLGENNSKAIIWELQKIYHITRYGVEINEDREVVLEDDDYNEDFRKEMGQDPLEYLKDDDDIFWAVYDILSPIEKDNFLTLLINKKNTDDLYEIIQHGGNVLYTPNDLHVSNYDYKDLDEFEGEIKPVPELDNAQAVIYELYDNYTLATYEQYQALINHTEMMRIEMEAEYKEKNPIKYWEFLKQRR